MPADDPRGLYGRGLERLGTDKVAGRMTPSKVGDPLGRQILGLLWEPLDENDLKAIGQRYAELKRVIAGITDCECMGLLTRLDRGGDLYKDFEYRLRRQTRKGFRDLLAERAKNCKIVPYIPPPYLAPPVIHIPPPPPPDPWQWPPRWPTPQPQPQPQFQSVNLKLEGEWELWKREVGVLRYFKLVATLKGKLSGEATPNPGGPNLKIGKTAEGWKTSLEQTLASGGSLEIEPHDGKLKITGKQTFDVLDSFEIPLFGGALFKVLPSISIKSVVSGDWDGLTAELPLGSVVLPGEVDGVEVKGEAELSLELELKIDWEKLLEEALKRGIDKVIDGLLDELFELLGAALGRYVLLALGVGFLVYLVHDRGAPDPIADPRTKDIKGFDDVLDWAGGDAKAQLKLIEMDAELRHSFAAGYGGMMDRLTSPDWERTLVNEAGAVYSDSQGFYKPPKSTAKPKEWRDWAVTNAGKGLTQARVPLGTDLWRERFRVAELALLYATAANLRGQLPSINYLRGAANWHASLAGEEAALQRVLHVIHENTYTLTTKDKKQTKVDGRKQWAAIVKLVALDKHKKDHRRHLVMGLAAIDELASVEN